MNTNPKGEKDGWGDKLRAAERARENLYFAKIDEQLLDKIRENETQARREAKKDPGLGTCPRCEESLRSGIWRELQIEFCPECGGLWLDPGDLLQLVDRDELDLHLVERPPSDAT